MSRRSSGANTPTLEFADRAAETIQRNFRGFKDRLKAREKAAFNINQLIEYAEEQDHLNLNKFFMRWIKLIKNTDNEQVTQYVSSSIQDDQSQYNEDNIKIEPSYTGPHLSATFNEADFKKLLYSFKNNEILHTKYVLMILNNAIRCLEKLPNQNEIECLDHVPKTEGGAEIAEDYRVNVIGDLHGQFIDLFTIFDLNNLPSPSNVYLFNGDFVDRGRQQCEVYLTLLYGLVLYGTQFNCFFLNRGNHEDYGCSVRFGFKEEVMTKYCLYSKIIMKRCAQSFALLPLYSIIRQQGYKDAINKILVGKWLFATKAS